MDMHLNFCRTGPRASLKTAGDLVEEPEDRDGEVGGKSIDATEDLKLLCSNHGMRSMAHDPSCKRSRAILFENLGWRNN